MATIRNLKQVDHQTSNLVYGFCRGIYKLFPSNNAYYSVKSGIIDICVAFYWFPWLCHWKVGDSVKIEHGKTGVVRYIGFHCYIPDLTKEEWVIGIELDCWSANAGDGSVYGKRLFTATPGRGYFTTQESVLDMRPGLITEGAYAQLKGLLHVPKFNGETVKICEYVEKKGRWKVQLLHAKHSKKYLGVLEKNLNPIFNYNWVPSITSSQNEQESLTEKPNIGDRVKTRKGKYGIVKYIGNTDFASSSNVIYVGLELEEWDPNGQNGTVKRITYFEAKHGYGYFVKLENLIENLGKPQ